MSVIIILVIIIVYEQCHVLFLSPKYISSFFVFHLSIPVRSLPTVFCISLCVLSVNMASSYGFKRLSFNEKMDYVHFVILYNAVHSHSEHRQPAYRFGPTLIVQHTGSTSCMYAECWVSWVYITYVLLSINYNDASYLPVHGALGAPFSVQNVYWLTPFDISFFNFFLPVPFRAHLILVLWVLYCNTLHSFTACFPMDFRKQWTTFFPTGKLWSLTFQHT